MTTTTTACALCGCTTDAPIHHAEVNGHDYAPELTEAVLQAAELRRRASEYRFSTPCPAWADDHGLTDHWHASELFDDGRQGRYHQGPGFGPYVLVTSIEYAHEEGVQHLSGTLCADTMDRDWSPAELVDLARNLLGAARWIEEHQ